MSDPVTKENIYSLTVSRLGPIFKTEDKAVLNNIIDVIVDEAMSIANMSDITTAMKELRTQIIQGSIIAYESRGVENQTRQGELGQENHFQDALFYLQTSIVNNGKRYVI